MFVCDWEKKVVAFDCDAMKAFVNIGELHWFESCVNTHNACDSDLRVVQYNMAEWPREGE